MIYKVNKKMKTNLKINGYCMTYNAAKVSGIKMFISNLTQI